MGLLCVESTSLRWIPSSKGQSVMQCFGYFVIILSELLKKQLDGLWQSVKNILLSKEAEVYCPSCFIEGGRSWHPFINLLKTHCCVRRRNEFFQALAYELNLLNPHAASLMYCAALHSVEIDESLKVQATKIAEMIQCHSENKFNPGLQTKSLGLKKHWT